MAAANSTNASIEPGSLFEDDFQKLIIDLTENEDMDPCPCGCFRSIYRPGHFRTRDKNTLELHVVSADKLNYHGFKYQPSQIAMLWKKDYRAFLWKGKAHQSTFDCNGATRANSSGAVFGVEQHGRK